MYKAVIGLEVHTELNTKSKMFSRSKNEYTKEVNSNITEIDLALPGILPLPNKEGVRKALKLAMCLNCETPSEVMFDRKNYYYADLPKGYQLTQMTKPFGKKGYLDISVNGTNKRIGIHQLHLEEDSASMTHMSNYSLLDYNRAGVPLIEIVSEPDMNTIDEVIEYLENLRSIIKYANISEASAEKGQLRVDVNISMMKETDSVLGTRAEIKNINSFNTVKEVIAYEMKRQEEILTSGGKVIQETRRWDDAKKETVSMREKVDAIDYRYYVDPNIPVVKISDEFKEDIRKTIPVLPRERYNKYITLGVSEKDAKSIVREKEVSDYFDNVLSYGVDAKEASNWMTTRLMGYMNQNNISISEVSLTSEGLASLIKMVSEGKISSQQGKEVFALSLEEGKSPEEIVREKGMEQISDEDSIREIVKEVIKNNSVQYEQYKAGKTALAGFFVGQTLKASEGKANPAIVNKLVNEELNK